MTDVLTTEQRKFNMSRIRAKNTAPEVKLRKLLWSEGIRGYRIHYNLPGKPDVVYVKKKIAIFIDGCFWHKCEFWMKKIQSNVDRDKKVNEQLKDEGWYVIRIWEHEIRKNLPLVVKKIQAILSEKSKNN